MTKLPGTPVPTKGALVPPAKPSNGAGLTADAKSSKAAGVAGTVASAAKGSGGIAQHAGQVVLDKAKQKGGDLARNGADRALGAASRPKEADSEAKADAKQAVRDVAAGAISGIPQGGWIGAAKGAVVAGATSKSTRKTITRVVIAMFAVMAITIGVFASLITLTMASAMQSTTDNNSGHAALADGVDEEALNIAYQTIGSTRLPWEVATWIASNTPDHAERSPELADGITRALPDAHDRSLLNGAIVNSGGRITLGTSTDDIARQELTEQGYTAALEEFYAEEDNATQLATNAFTTARMWAMGGAQTCAPTSAATGGAGGAGSGWSDLSPEQTENAQAIISAANAYLGDATPEQREHAALLALSNAMRESTLINVGHGDSVGPDSRGLFQQRDPWGPEEKRMNPHWSTTKFLSVVVQQEAWDTRPQEDISIAVQVFADAHKTDQVNMWPNAVQVYKDHSGTAPTIEPLAEFGVWGREEDGKAGAGSVASGSAANTSCAGGGVASVEGMPLDAADACLNDRFGMRFHPVHHVMRMHNGIDMSLFSPTAPVYALADGVVSEDLNSDGGTITVDYGKGLQVEYFHLDGSTQNIPVGTIVKSGEQIGVAGTTGTSTGPHLHMGVRQDGEYIDPLEILGGEEAVVAVFGQC